jgi:hypothetical protein
VTLYVASQGEGNFAAIVATLADRNAIAARKRSDRLFTASTVRVR